jgi:hypothetical protein
MQKELKMADVPVACNLTGNEYKARREEVTELFKLAQAVEELADGYSYSFMGSSEIAQKLTNFVLTERVCCPFFIFELQFAPNFSSIRLNLRGSAEIKQFLSMGESE